MSQQANANIKLSDIKRLIEQRQIFQAFLLLQKMKEGPHPEQGTWLEWSRLTTLTPFSFLGLEGARREFELYRTSEAKEFSEGLVKKFTEGRLKSSKEYPTILLVGIVQPGTEQRWKRCIESISLQFNSQVTVKLFLDQMANLYGVLPACVTTERVSSVNQAEIYERAIRESRSEIFSVIQDPSAIFSDHGLLLVGASFKTNPDIHIIQTERLTHGIEGVATPIRHELPEWSQALLLDPMCLESPSMLFDWRGVFMRRETLLNHGLPLDTRLPFATALDAASKIARIHQIHSLRAPVIVDDCPLEARSFLIPLSQSADAIEIIDREKRLTQNGFSTISPDILEIEAKRYHYHTFPRINSSILKHGEKVAPKITVVTTVLNDKTHIARCIESVLSQNYPNLEYIILDGGSTDGTKEIIERYRGYLAQFHSATDAGHYAAIQRGLRSSSGEIMTWLNSDDMLCPYSLRLVASVLSERKEIEWLTGNICITSEHNDLDISFNCHPVDPISYFDDAFDRPFIQQEGTFWRRSLWDRTGQSLDLRLSLAADMELWTRFLQFANVYTLTVPLGVFMRRKGQRSTILRNQYMHEAYSVIQKLRSQGVKPYTQKPQSPTILSIPLEEESQAAAR